METDVLLRGAMWRSSWYIEFVADLHCFVVANLALRAISDILLP